MVTPGATSTDGDTRSAEDHERTPGVDFSVQRQRRGVLGIPVLVRLPRVLFLNAAESGITSRHKSPCRQCKRPGRGNPRHEPRQVSDVIEVRVGKDDGVNDEKKGQGNGSQLRPRSSLSP